MINLLFSIGNFKNIFNYFQVFLKTVWHFFFILTYETCTITKSYMHSYIRIKYLWCHVIPGIIWTILQKKVTVLPEFLSGLNIRNVELSFSILRTHECRCGFLQITEYKKGIQCGIKCRLNKEYRKITRKK